MMISLSSGGTYLTGITPSDVYVPQGNPVLRRILFSVSYGRLSRCRLVTKPCSGRTRLVFRLGKRNETVVSSSLSENGNLGSSHLCHSKVRPRGLTFPMCSWRLTKRVYGWVNRGQGVFPSLYYSVVRLWRERLLWGRQLEGKEFNDTWNRTYQSFIYCPITIVLSETSEKSTDTTKSWTIGVGDPKTVLQLYCPFSIN